MSVEMTVCQVGCYIADLQNNNIYDYYLCRLFANPDKKDGCNKSAVE